MEELTELYLLNELSLEELEFGRFLHRIDASAPNEAIIAGIICIQFQIQGHLCTEMEDVLSSALCVKLIGQNIDKVQFINNIRSAGFIGKPEDSQPLILDNDKLYLQKIWKYEEELSEWLRQKAAFNCNVSNEGLEYVDSIFSESSGLNYQKIAVKLSLLKNLVFISGGPGTGKTYTVQKIISALGNSSPSPLKIALAAPTGKAAEKLQETLVHDNEQVEVHSAVTVHKLLGAEYESGIFKKNSSNKLIYDVVIIDEASMLDIHLWIGLIRAISTSTKLILLGDKNQLSSVEAGSILGDICYQSDNSFSKIVCDALKEEATNSDLKAINDSIVLLDKSYRVEDSSGIKVLSDAIKNGNSEETLKILRSNQHPNISLVESSSEAINDLIQNYVITSFSELKSNDYERDSIESHQVLCALRKGPYGVQEVNKLAEKELRKLWEIPSNELWYPGRPIIMMRSNNQLKLQNGQIGICKANEVGVLELVFENRNTSVSISRIQDYEVGFANTIHKSQGSEYDHVAIILSKDMSPILSRELLYTAVTRAKKSIQIISDENIVLQTIDTVVSRKSGIREKIWK